MEINTINSTKLRNEEHYKFQRDFSQLVGKYTPLALGVISMIDNHTRLLTAEELALDAFLKNPLTTEINLMDENRDGLLIGLRGTVKYATYHYDETIKAAAIKLMQLFDHYGEIERRSFSEETAAIIKLVSELNGTYAPLCQTVNVTGWINQLKEANLNFDALVNGRNSDMAIKPKLQLKAVRIEIDNQYRAIVKRINAIIEVTPQEAQLAFANELNQYIDKANLAIAQRQGRNAKNKDNESDDSSGGEAEPKK
jgi:hypothetical protein